MQLQDSHLILVKDVKIDGEVMYATRTSRIENQNTIDVSIVDIIDNTKEARTGIKEVPFLLFNEVPFLLFNPVECEQAKRSLQFEEIELVNMLNTIEDENNISRLEQRTKVGEHMTMRQIKTEFIDTSKIYWHRKRC